MRWQNHSAFAIQGQHKGGGACIGKASLRPQALLILMLVLLFPLAESAEAPWRGVDLSYVNELEDCGAVFRDKGAAADPYAIFAKAGANLVRLRLWHSPDWTSYSTLADVKKSMHRARQHGMRVLLDLHYSDDWAHPGKQIIPAAWREAESTRDLARLVYEYTTAVLDELDEAGLWPEYVQVGNEINTELLLPEEVPEGTPINWQRNIALLNAGIRAVRESGNTKRSTPGIMIHIAQPENVEPWFDAALENGLDEFELIGISYYPKWSEMPFHNMRNALGHFRAKYRKEIVVVETAYPWTLAGMDAAANILGEDSLVRGYPASKDGQRRFMLELMAAVRGSGGLGVVYWEPAWISSTCSTRWGKGSHWENAALFDYSDAELHEGADFLRPGDE